MLHIIYSLNEKNIEFICFFLSFFLILKQSIIFWTLCIRYNNGKTVATCCQLWAIWMRHVLVFGAGAMEATSAQWYSDHNRKSTNAAFQFHPSPTIYSTVSSIWDNYILTSGNLPINCVGKISWTMHSKIQFQYSITIIIIATLMFNYEFISMNHRQCWVHNRVLDFPGNLSCSKQTFFRSSEIPFNSRMYGISFMILMN